SVSRNQLVGWDGSARAWLRAGDERREIEQSQLNALLRDFCLDVNDSSGVIRGGYGSVNACPQNVGEPYIWSSPDWKG
ncbi:hypothetical protein CC78DRAFT_465996, partial [Lojkania enalia]